MLGDKEIKEITDLANEAINRQCPQLENDIKPYMVKYIFEAYDRWLKKKR